MSSLDTNKPFQTAVSEKHFNGYWIPNHNAKVIKAAIENGTAPFLPDQSGKISANAIYNGNTGYCLNAKDLIPLQIERGEKSNVVATYNTINKAGTKVVEGSKGLFYNYKREDGTIGTAQFFFPEQTENPEAVKKLTEEKIRKNGGRKLNKTIEITSAEPEEYLAHYVAACKSGASVKVSPEIAKEFVTKFTPLLNNQIAKGAERDKEMDTLGQFMFKVDVKANKINSELFAQVKKEHQKSQAQGKKKDMEISM